MFHSSTVRTKAIFLRKTGKSYSEISQLLNISKSTLHYWLRNIILASEQEELINLKRLNSAKKGGNIRKLQRINQTDKIINKAKTDIKKLNKYELFLIGIALYWAEGAKQKKHNVSERVCFANSDVKMVKIFLTWLDKICNIKHSEITFQLYLHSKTDKKIVLDYWIKQLKVSENEIRIYLKKHKISPNRKNHDKSYVGLMRLIVKRSTNLNRKIHGWIQGIYKNCGVV